MKRIIVIGMLLLICISLISCDKNKQPVTQSATQLPTVMETTKPTSTTKPSLTETNTPIPTAMPSPTEVNTPTLTKTPVVTDKHIIREQANAYLEVINELVTKFGAGAVKVDSDYQITGLGVVRLIDFDNDGNYELYCAFSTDGFCVDTERIYSFHDNTAVLIMEGGVSNPGTDVSPCTTFLSKDGKTYIWHQYEICTGSIETVEKNSMVVIITYYDDFWDEINYKLDGKPCTKVELDTAIDNFTNDKNVNQIDYYYPIDPSVITETDNVIQLLKDKAR